MKHAAGPRREIGVRTIFNLLGPFTNPAGADRQLLGLFDRSRTEMVAEVLRGARIKTCAGCGSLDGLDEISISSATQVTELQNGECKTYEITPEDLGLRVYALSEVAGGDAEVNAEIIRRYFQRRRTWCIP